MTKIFLVNSLLELDNKLKYELDRFEERRLDYRKNERIYGVYCVRILQNEELLGWSIITNNKNILRYKYKIYVWDKLNDKNCFISDDKDSLDEIIFFVRENIC